MCLNDPFVDEMARSGWPLCPSRIVCQHILILVVGFGVLLQYIGCDMGKDPCRVDNGGCDHYCHFQQGELNCTCSSGFELQKDGHTCKEENPCERNNGGCSHYCHFENRTVTCHCAVGFQRQHDGRSCKEINPCEDRNGGCEHSCSYDQGQLRCHCAAGFELRSDGKSCKVTSCQSGNRIIVTNHCNMIFTPSPTEDLNVTQNKLREKKKEKKTEGFKEVKMED
ncbi:hypothetical protein CDAR_399571 [Caerostris darwini]|uniref:EGF-like domain-containing protein n=1 Tax=Caerostris darwini TaxID=1538125 RepID=A0AAV4RLN9_9ARAC|nr:hypothetical protein CDAR_399571 [Caerostris darwini]